MGRRWQGLADARFVRAGVAALAVPLVLCCGPAGAATAAALQRPYKEQATALSAPAAALLQRVVTARDNGSAAFAIVDKKAARVHVFNAAGVLQGSSPVLLGLARGDDSVPGIGERKMSEIRPVERTTPAGRFQSEPGRNLQGEDIVWIDYDAAVSMHRVRVANRADRRAERLATPTVADNRISFGCINVPADFYDRYLMKSLGTHAGMVYVLPETRSMQTQFRALFVDAPAQRAVGAAPGR